MLRKLFTVTVTLLLVISLVSCKKAEPQPDINQRTEEDLLLAALTSTWEKAYFFVLKKDGTLIAARGEGSLQSLREGTVKQEKAESTVLPAEKLISIMSILNELGNFTGEKAIVYDARTAEILYNGNENSFVFGLSKNENYDILIIKLIVYSPFEITDSRHKQIRPANYLDDFYYQ